MIKTLAVTLALLVAVNIYFKFSPHYARQRAFQAAEQRIADKIMKAGEEARKSNGKIDTADVYDIIVKYGQCSAELSEQYRKGDPLPNVGC